MGSTLAGSLRRHMPPFSALQRIAPIVYTHTVPLEMDIATFSASARLIRRSRLPTCHCARQKAAFHPLWSCEACEACQCSRQLGDVPSPQRQRPHHVRWHGAGSPSCMRSLRAPLRSLLPNYGVSCGSQSARSVSA